MAYIDFSLIVKVVGVKEKRFILFLESILRNSCISFCLGSSRSKPPNPTRFISDAFACMQKAIAYATVILKGMQAYVSLYSNLFSEI